MSTSRRKSVRLLQVTAVTGALGAAAIASAGGSAAGQCSPGAVTATSAVAPGGWSVPVELTEGTYEITRPVVVMSATGQRITAMWRRFDPLALESVTSTDFGTTWRRPVRMRPAVQRGTSYQLAGSRDGRRLVSVWLRGSRLFAGHRILGRGAWSRPVRLATGVRASMTPVLDLATSANGRRVVVTYPKSDVLMARVSDDGGATWAQRRWVSRLGQGGQQGHVVMSKSGKRLLAAWNSGNVNNRVVMLAAGSRDGGKKWSRPRRLIRADSMQVQNNQGPLLSGSTGGRRATVVWALERYDPYASVVQAVSTSDFGASWSRPQQVALGAGPAIAASSNGNTLTLGYGLNRTFAYSSRTSVNAGSTWQTAVATRTRSDPYFGPALSAAADGAPTLVGWDRSVHVVQGTRSGAVWSAPVVLSDATWALPSVAVAANGTHRVVVWNEEGHPRASVAS